jgi:predicted nucleic acid-binding protein
LARNFERRRHDARKTILDCALAAEADHIVSGDKRHLLPLRQFRGIPIVIASDFLRRLK